MNALLEIKNLYGGYTKGVDILRGIDMEVQQGEAVGIIGLNGSGKSTLGRAIMNMLPFRHGCFSFDKDDIGALRTHELARRGLALMPQGGRVFRTLSVWDNLKLADKAAGGRRIEVLQDFVPLLKRPRRELQRLMADKLSGGLQHELSLAMTLASGPSFVVLDEPSAGLSPKATEEMYTILSNCREKLNLTIILIEQNIAKALDFCNRTLLLQQGQIAREFKGDSSMSVKEIMFNE